MSLPCTPLFAWPRSFKFQKSAAALSVAVALALSGCGWFGESEENLPHFKLTEFQKQWAAPYQKGAEWKFRSQQTGYVRTYVVEQYKHQEHKMGPGGWTLEKTHYREEIDALLVRKDSTFVLPGAFLYTFALTAQVDEGYSGYSHSAGYSNIGQCKVQGFGVSMSLPLRELETGQLALSPPYSLLPQLTLNGRTYQRVISRIPTTPMPDAGRQVLYTQAEGVLQFEELGQVWVRE
ncbi:hypothetical protein FY528_00880 [Hymenobacter lutimineralis]|uniref:Lipoprotein n=1 Tax=Hymenobacter lutimineralis TaxID=2606448 RepID=A0A5D6VIT9_9BACT|nr:MULTISPECIES: hypothetical protein [Hymenobacter]QIX60265.1 hypothetical protein HER32_03290 [Hymenobacter sp. BT18]TYZ14314.1 hypothetical protein FY528_00880 [Hymenobacter lutimineralis]